MIILPYFPERSVVVISVPPGIHVTPTAKANFENLLKSNPHDIFFCGVNAEQWQDYVLDTIVLDDLGYLRPPLGEFDYPGLVPIVRDQCVNTIGEAYEITEGLYLDRDWILCFYKLDRVGPLHVATSKVFQFKYGVMIAINDIYARPRAGDTVLMFPVFPSNCVIVVSFPNCILGNNRALIDYSNLLLSKPKAILFCGDDADYLKTQLEAVIASDDQDEKHMEDKTTPDLKIFCYTDCISTIGEVQNLKEITECEARTICFYRFVEPEDVGDRSTQKYCFEYDVMLIGDFDSEVEVVYS